MNTTASGIMGGNEPLEKGGEKNYEMQQQGRRNLFPNATALI